MKNVLFDEQSHIYLVLALVPKNGYFYEKKKRKIRRFWVKEHRRSEKRICLKDAAFIVERITENLLDQERNTQEQFTCARPCRSSAY